MSLGGGKGGLCFKGGLKQKRNTNIESTDAAAAAAVPAPAPAAGGVAALPLCVR